MTTRRLALALAALLPLLANGPGRVLAQDLYVANNRGDTVGEYDATTGAAVTNPLVSVLDGPMGIGASGGNIYLSIPGASTVNAYNATTGATVVGFTPINTGTNSNVFGVVASGSQLYLADQSLETVRAYNQTTGAVAAGFTPITGLTFTGSMALAGTTLYVFDNPTYGGNGGTVRTYDALTGQLLNSSLVTGLYAVSDFMALKNNVLYVELDNNTVQAFNATTGAAQPGFTTISKANSELEGVAVSGNNLFVADYQNNVVGEYNATTGALVNANFLTGLAGPTGLAIGAVPEPSTWALLVLGGAGGLALGVRGRRVRRA